MGVSISVIQKLNPVLNGWCTYFRVGNSNRTFHKVDWAVRSELQLWLRRKHQCPWRAAKKRWGYRFLHERCRLYRMVGKVSHWKGCGACRRTKVIGEPDAGNLHVRFDEGTQETDGFVPRLRPTLRNPRVSELPLLYSCVVVST